jgi:hypothetical protein
MTTPDLSRKVRQLDNDVQSIYEILARIELTQGRHTNRFNEMGHDLDGLRARLDAHDGRFDAHDARFDAIDARLDTHDTRFDAIDTRLDNLDTKLDRVIALVSGDRDAR